MLVNVTVIFMSNPTLVLCCVEVRVRVGVLSTNVPSDGFVQLISLKNINISVICDQSHLSSEANI